MSDLLNTIQRLTDEEISLFISEKNALDLKQPANGEYIHHLAKLLRHVHGFQESKEPALSHEEVYQTILECPDENSMHIFDEVPFQEKTIQGKVAFVGITNTEIGVLDLVSNFHGFAMLYCLKLPVDEGMTMIAWHRDFLLDLAEYRPRHQLPSIQLSHNEDKFFKFYADKQPNNKGLLSESIISSLRTLPLAAFGQQCPVDFSIKNNKICVLIRSIPGPFGLHLATNQSGFSTIQDDLFKINQQITLFKQVCAMIESHIE